ncbi:unnamed protein product, partial [Mycena citricolor]
MSQLPAELQREIFETAARNDRSTIPTLLLVARHVHAWIEPLLFHVVINMNVGQRTALRSLMQTRPPDFFRRGVRHLWLDESAEWSSTETLALLSLCPLIRSFAFRLGLSPEGVLPILDTFQHLRYLDGFLELIFGSRQGIDLGRPFFQRLTHLSLFDVIDKTLCSGLATLPALTHLALQTTTSFRFTSRLLSTCTSLRVLVKTAKDFENAEIELKVIHRFGLEDPRLVLIVVRNLFDKYWSDREVGALGGKNMWVIADDFVARKGSGEMEKSHYIVEQPLWDQYDVDWEPFDIAWGLFDIAW